MCKGFPTKLIVFIFIFASVIVACNRLGSYSARRHFEALLSGDKDVRLSGVEFFNRTKRAVVDDTQSLKYLTVSFQKARKGSEELGTAYNAIIRLASGESVRVWAYVSAGPRLTILCYPDTIGDGDYYTVDLTDPVPAPLAAILTDLR
jgi:hypothetical protein